MYLVHDAFDRNLHVGVATRHNRIYLRDCIADFCRRARLAPYIWSKVVVLDAWCPRGSSWLNNMGTFQIPVSSWIRFKC